MLSRAFEPGKKFVFFFFKNSIDWLLAIRVSGDEEMENFVFYKSEFRNKKLKKKLVLVFRSRKKSRGKETLQFRKVLQTKKKNDQLNRSSKKSLCREGARIEKENEKKKFVLR